jgi:hypothetical protein
VTHTGNRRRGVGDRHQAQPLLICLFSILSRRSSRLLLLLRSEFLCFLPYLTDWTRSPRTYLWRWLSDLDITCPHMHALRHPRSGAWSVSGYTRIEVPPAFCKTCFFNHMHVGLLQHSWLRLRPCDSSLLKGKTIPPLSPVRALPNELLSRRSQLPLLPSGGDNAPFHGQNIFGIAVSEKPTTVKLRCAFLFLSSGLPRTNVRWI